MTKTWAVLSLHHLLEQQQVCPPLPVHSSSVLSELNWPFKHSEGSPNALTSDLHTSLQREWRYYWAPLKLVVSLPLCLSFPVYQYRRTLSLRCTNTRNPLIFRIPSSFKICKWLYESVWSSLQRYFFMQWQGRKISHEAISPCSCCRSGTSFDVHAQSGHYWDSTVKRTKSTVIKASVVWVRQMKCVPS